VQKVKFSMVGDHEGVCIVLYVVLSNNMVVV